jgi:hypothetical protein
MEKNKMTDKPGSKKISDIIKTAIHKASKTAVEPVFEKTPEGYIIIKEPLGIGNRNL